MAQDTLLAMSRLATHPSITHFELRPVDRTGLVWRIAYRDVNTEPPAYSGGAEGTIAQCLAIVLGRADKIKKTKKMKRIS
jgi:hypothetical protein